MASVDMSLITSIGAQAGIPPSVLYAVGMNSSGFNDQGVTADDKVGVFGIPLTTLETFGFSPDQVAGNLPLQAQLAARMLAQNYSKYGSWDKTLSAFRTGNPDASSSPTDSTSGWVTGVLGISATQANLGLDNQIFQSGDYPSQHFAQMLGELGNTYQEFANKGGIVTHDHVAAFQQAIGRFSPSRQPPRSTSGGGPTTIGDGYSSTGPGEGAFASDRYPWGQCTWFVAGTLPWLNQVGNLGDAHDWLGSAQNKGLGTSQTPVVGAAVVYGSGNGYSDVGHVGVVTKINGDGSFQVTSDHWGGLGQTHIGDSTMRDVEGFILPPSTQDGISGAQKALELSGAPQKQIAEISKNDQQQATATAANHQAKQDAQTRPNPQKVADFASDGKSAGLTPQHVLDNAENFWAMSRYLGLHPDLKQFAQTQGMTQPQIADWLKAQPLPHAPTVQAGHFKQMYDMATLHSLNQARRMPHSSEVTRFAQSNMGDTQVSAYYKNLVDSEAQTSNTQQSAGDNPRLRVM